jgi:hypothetical protein
MFDRFVSFGMLQVAVPFASHWRPWAVAWGVVGVYLLVAISITSALMSRLPRRLWHGVHLTSFGLFVTITVHALTAGTDVRHGGWRWAMFGPLAAVGVLGVVRMVMGGRRRAPPRRSGGRPTGSRPVPVGQCRVPPVADGPCTRADEDGALRRRAATATCSAPSSATAAQTVNRRPRPLRAPGREPSRT